MSDFDPVLIDIRDCDDDAGWEPEVPVIAARAVPRLVANELRRIYHDAGDPGLYWLIIRAQELEEL